MEQLREKHTIQVRSGDKMTLNDADKKTMLRIKMILDRGNNVEVKRKSDGTIALYEVRKKIVS